MVDTDLSQEMIADFSIDERKCILFLLLRSMFKQQSSPGLLKLKPKSSSFSVQFACCLPFANLPALRTSTLRNLFSPAEGGGYNVLQLHTRRTTNEYTIFISFYSIAAHCSKPNPNAP